MGSSLPRGDSCAVGRPWTPEEAAEFAARRDFRLVQLLASDRSAFRAARRLGVFAVRSTVTRSGSRTQMQGSQTGQGGRQQRRRRRDTAIARGAAAEFRTAPQCSLPEAWWQSKQAAISADAQASHARSRAMVQEMQGLLHEMQHSVAVPAEPPAPALLDDSMVGTEAAVQAGVPAETAAAGAAVSLRAEPPTDTNPGDGTATAHTQRMDTSPPISPPSSPSRITGWQEAALLQQASDTLAVRSTQRLSGDAETLWPLPQGSRARATRGKGVGSRGAHRDDRC